VGGQRVDHAGKYYKVNARLFDPPAEPIPLMVTGNGCQTIVNSKDRIGEYGDFISNNQDKYGELHSQAVSAGLPMPVWLFQDLTAPLLPPSVPCFHLD
jgi:hypothetical protein